MAAVTVPTLIVQGDRDLQVRAEDARLLAGAQPAARLHLARGVHHVLVPAPLDPAANFATCGNAGLPLERRAVTATVDFLCTALLGTKWPCVPYRLAGSFAPWSTPPGGPFCAAVSGRRANRRTSTIKSALSGHLAVLRAADLVWTEKRGTQGIYRLNTTTFQDVMAQALGAFGLGAEEKEAGRDAQPN